MSDLPRFDDVRGAGPFGDPAFWGVALAAAIASVVVGGWSFPANNNVFHLPIVAGLVEAPEFAGDPFVRSLRHFASGVWMVAAGSARLIDPKISFLVLHVASRVLAMVGFLACADELGVRSTRQRAVAAALLSVTFLLRGTSFAGEGGLFVDYFSHSEIGNGLFLLMVRAILRGSLGAAVATIGIAIFVNAFFGVWMAFVLGVTVAAEAVGGRWTTRGSLGGLGAGVAVAAVFVAPVAANILANPDFGRPIDFDHAEFLAYYYPYHFLFGEVPAGQKLGLALVTVAMLCGLAALADPRRRRMGAVVVAATALYALGIVAPSLTHAPLVLDLHLLRAGTLIHELAALLVVLVAVRRWFDTDRARRAVVAPALIVALAVPRGGPAAQVGAAMVIAILCLDRLLADPVWHRRLDGFVGDRDRLLRGGAIVVAVALTGVGFVRTEAKLRVSRAWTAEWTRVSAWAREATPVGSVFQVPVVRLTDPDPRVAAEKEALAGATVFETISRRSLWVDFKRGAAVMWSPSLHAVWRRRVDEVAALDGTAARIDHARRHDISHVIEIAPAGCRGDFAFRTERLCVTRVDRSRPSLPSPGGAP